MPDAREAPAVVEIDKKSFLLDLGGDSLSRVRALDFLDFSRECCFRFLWDKKSDIPQSKSPGRLYADLDIIWASDEAGFCRDGVHDSRD